MKRWSRMMFVCAVAWAIAPASFTAPSWGTTSPSSNGAIPYPSGLTSWQDPGSGSTINDCSVTFPLNGINVSTTTITAITIGQLDNTSTPEILTTTFKLVADTYISGLQTGVQNNAGNQAQGLNNYVAYTSFLNPGIQVLDAGTIDNTCNLTVYSRGRNSEDFGSSSDSTQAPDAGNYNVSVQLRATW